MRIGYLAAAFSVFLMTGSGTSLGAPPSTPATEAYAFRAQMSQEPVCQRLSREADNAFLHSQMDMETKVRELNRIEALARENRCLQKYPMARGSSGGSQKIGPPSADVNAAYAFRAHMSQEAACQQLSREADNVFMHSRMDAGAKVQELNRIEALARENRCLQKYPMSRGGG